MFSASISEAGRLICLFAKWGKIQPFTILDTRPEPLTSDGPVLAFIYLNLVHSEQSVGPPRTRVSSSRLSSGLQNALREQPSVGCQACVSLRGWTLLPV